MTTRPSSFSQHPWIYAHGPRQIRREAKSQVIGKWLVFVEQADVDAVWKKIAAATLGGQLGIAAKVATSWPNRVARSRKRVVCVYTHDYTDLDDVARVLIALRDLGLKERLSYKTDVDTLAGWYGSGAATYVSQPNQATFEIRRSSNRHTINNQRLNSCGHSWGSQVASSPHSKKPSHDPPVHQDF